MATPTILVDSATGSDTTGSGAGPGTSISGSTGRTRNTASQTHFGLFGATDDCSGVATDGSATLYAAISTAGQRNHSSITGVKNTRHVDIGTITSGAAILSAIASTSGWTAGDVIKVTGAAAASADLYSTILSVDSSTQVTLNDNAGTSVSGAVVENPKQFTLGNTGESLNTGATNTAWATGGKRATVFGTNSLKLFDNNSAAGDAMPAWIVEMQSAHAESPAATVNTRRSGSASGPITLRGTSGAVTRPLLTFTNNGNGIVVRGPGQVFQDFEMRNSNATKTASIAFQSGSSGPALFRNIKISHSTNKFWKGLGLSIEGYKIVDCEIGYCANVGIDGQVASPEVQNCWIHNCTSHGMQTGATVMPLVIVGNIFSINGGDGINSGFSGGSTTQLYGQIAFNTFDSNTSDGLEFSAAGAFPQRWAALDIVNNIFSNNSGYGLNMSGGSVTDAMLQANLFRLLGNNFYNNTLGKYNPNTITVSEYETTTNPTFTNTGGNDYSIGTNLKAKGYPLGGTLPVGTTSSTYSYVSPGAAQPQATGGGGGCVIGSGIIGSGVSL